MGIAPRSTDWDWFLVIVFATSIFGAVFFGAVCSVAIHFIIKFW